MEHTSWIEKTALHSIDEMAELEDGWLFGSGKAIAESVRERAKRFLSVAIFLPEPYVAAPTEEGGILIEYEADGWIHAIQFFPDDETTFFGFQLEGGEQFSWTFDADDWKGLLGKVREALKR